MYYLLGFLLLIIPLLTAGLSACSSGSGKQDHQNDQDNLGQNNPDDTIKPVFSKADVKKKMLLLALSPTPKDLNAGAMCYSPRPMEDTVTYVCPVCSEKTHYIYPTNPDQINSINQCRYEARLISGFEVTLDEHEFCRKCSPSVTKPALNLLVKIAGDSFAKKTAGISLDDLRLLKEFSEGKVLHTHGNDAEVPLKDYLQRIGELLGVATN